MSEQDIASMIIIGICLLISGTVIILSVVSSVNHTKRVDQMRERDQTRKLLEQQQKVIEELQRVINEKERS